MTANGVDYAWSHPGGAALQKAGMHFACRYLSHDTTGKNIAKAEATDLAAHGVSVVVVWETTANRARAGRAAGVADARDALEQATVAGMPAGRPIYFAIDYDAPARDQPPIDAYFSGVASVIGLARTGAYGGYWPLARLKSAGLARWFWQTDAWSGSNTLPGRHLHQHAATIRIGGVSCDKNTALADDYGQWMPGKAPAASKEDGDVQLTDTVKLGNWVKTWPKDTELRDGIKVNTALASGYAHARRADENVLRLVAQMGALTEMVAALAKGGGLTPEQAKAAAQAGAQAALAELGTVLTKED